ncbi:hypothetical protein VNO77_03828 [Canavalia gladiata]|uniref:Uncharacterized protein n=1 Tax=Canavalia gladiata TaxID=3824 RepID=A0AAN9R776_CANGL
MHGRQTLGLSVGFRIGVANLEFRDVLCLRIQIILAYASTSACNQSTGIDMPTSAWHASIWLKIKGSSRNQFDVEFPHCFWRFAISRAKKLALPFWTHLYSVYLRGLFLNLAKMLLPQ